MTAKQQFKEGLITNNPVLVQQLQRGYLRHP